MFNKNPNINNSKVNFNNTIQLKNAYFSKDMSPMKQKLIIQFMKLMRNNICFKTKLAYNIDPPTKHGTLVIPIDILANNDISKERSIVENKIRQLKIYLEKDINYLSMSNSDKYFLSFFMHYDLDYKNMLYIQCKSLLKKVPISLKPINLTKTTINFHKFDKDSIIEIYNPYLDKSLISLDLSVEYKEMSYDYNALHVFEHISCIPWTKLNSRKDNNDLILMNGLTVPVGLSYVYAFLNNESGFKRYFKNMIKWLYRRRNEVFVKENLSNIKHEITRTISETKETPSPSVFARSSGKAYDLYPDINIFLHWMNEPYNLLIIHPYKNFDIKHFEIPKFNRQFPLRPITLKSPKLKWFPLTVLNEIKKSENINITKKVPIQENANKIINYIEKHEIADGFIGKDVVIQSIKDLKEKSELKIMEFFPISIITTFKDVLKEEKIEEIAVNLLMNMNIMNLFSPMTCTNINQSNFFLFDED